MIYEVRLMREAELDLVRLAKSEPKAYAKAKRFLGELAEHQDGHRTSRAVKRTAREPLEPRNHEETPYGLPHLRHGGLCGSSRCLRTL